MVCMTCQHFTYAVDHLKKRLNRLITEVDLGILEGRQASPPYSMRLLVLICLIACSNSPAFAGYNAIFFAPKNNVVGASYGQETKEKAIKKARRQCRKRGGRGCELATWSNRCCSLYVSPSSGKYGWGASWGNSLKKANAKAYKACKKRNMICVWRISACEDGYEE